MLTLQKTSHPSQLTSISKTLLVLLALVSISPTGASLNEGSGEIPDSTVNPPPQLIQSTVSPPLAEIPVSGPSSTNSGNKDGLLEHLNRLASLLLQEDLHTAPQTYQGKHVLLDKLISVETQANDYLKAVGVCLASGAKLYFPKKSDNIKQLFSLLTEDLPSKIWVNFAYNKRRRQTLAPAGDPSGQLPILSTEKDSIQWSTPLTAENHCAILEEADEEAFTTFTYTKTRCSEPASVICETQLPEYLQLSHRSEVEKTLPDLSKTISELGALIQSDHKTQYPDSLLQACTSVQTILESQKPLQDLQIVSNIVQYIGVQIFSTLHQAATKHLFDFKVLSQQVQTNLNTSQPLRKTIEQIKDDLTLVAKQIREVNDTLQRTPSKVSTTLIGPTESTDLVNTTSGPPTTLVKYDSSNTATTTEKVNPSTADLSSLNNSITELQQAIQILKKQICNCPSDEPESPIDVVSQLVISFISAALSTFSTVLTIVITIRQRRDQENRNSQVRNNARVYFQVRNR